LRVVLLFFFLLLENLFSKPQAEQLTRNVTDTAHQPTRNATAT
jgi:hypothetical protein